MVARLRHEVAELIGGGGLLDGHLEGPHLDGRPGGERVGLRLDLAPCPERRDGDQRGDHAGSDALRRRHVVSDGRDDAATEPEREVGAGIAGMLHGA